MKNDILKKYYTYTPFKKSTFKQRFLNFFKRHNVFGIMNEDVKCLELADRVLQNFRPNEMIDKDPFLRKARQALVNAIVFRLYFKHTPNEADFENIINLLECAKEETPSEVWPSSLSFMYASVDTWGREHTGMKELEIFDYAPPSAARTVVCDILQNFKSPAACKQLFQKSYCDE